MPDPVKRFIGAVEDEWQLFSDREADYAIGPPIGFGASSIVYSATYHTTSISPPIPCALKVVDLDVLPPRSLSLLQRETNLMSLSKHPNVLRVRGSWMNGHKLFIALRLMNKGSAADVMRYGWPGGMEEDVIVCILRQALQGLNYLHINGFIHRDVKAANLLVDDDGTVLLGDLGVAADLAEDTSLLPSSKLSVLAASSSFAQSHPQENDNAAAHAKRVVLFDHTHTTPVIERPRVGKRKSFVGTPCWMAPELIQGRQYDASADIWSFGITALELSQGRPPRSKDTPHRVLLKTIQDDPPTLDREGGVYKYSRAFKEVIDWCLNKDPSSRPTCEELLQTPLFRGAKKKSYLMGAILKDLPPLALRQERCAIKNAHTLLTLDSWDFATTLNSPTAATFRHRAPMDNMEKVATVDGPLNMEGQKLDSEHGQHSTSISWVGDSVKQHGEQEPLEKDSPSSDSDVSSALADSMPSPTASGRKSSPSSSIIELAHEEPASQVPGNNPPDAADEKQVSAVEISSQTARAVPISSRRSVHGQFGFWNRLKTNVRRSTSRNDLSGFQSGGKEKGTGTSSAGSRK